jgi:hypothetical protein
VIRRPARLRAALALVAALACAAVPAGAEPRLEYRLQAAYVSKFLRFVEWPEGAKPASVYRVGAVGSAEFLEAMGALDGYEVGKAKIALTRVEGVASLEGLHALVIGPAEPSALELLHAARERPILTISDAADWNDHGGIVQFVVVDAAMRFHVNIAAAERVELDISSRLLRLAVEVKRTWSP